METDKMETDKPETDKNVLDFKKELLQHLTLKYFNE